MSDLIEEAGHDSSALTNVKALRLPRAIVPPITIMEADMAYKTILAIVGTSTSDQFLRQAAELSYSAGAHLSVLAVVLAAPPPDYAAMISDAWLEEQQEDRRRLDEKVTNARDILSTSAGSFEVGGLYCEATWAHGEIGTRAMYADLLLMGDAEIIGSHLRRQAIDGALFDARRPVLLVPKTRPVTLSPRKVILAWDSGPDAASAAREALELMKGAERVNVVMVDPNADQDRQGEDPGADIAAYLARQGIKVMVDRFASGDRTIAETLRQRASELSADLLVMGAYGHSRLRERIFGGVTQSMIDTATVPVLLAR